MKPKSERNLNITKNSHKLEEKKTCSRKNVKNAKKISVSLRECDIHRFFKIFYQRTILLLS